MVGLNAPCAMLIEAGHAISQQTNTLHKIVNDERLEHIEFEVSGCASDIDGHIVAKHLTAQHGQRIALRRVDLPWHE